MTIVPKIIAAILGAAVFGLGYGRWHFHSVRTALTLSLADSPLPRRREDLPEKVRAFAERGMAGSAELARIVRLRQSAEFRSARGGRFLHLSARQEIASAVPGFVWDARHRKGPLTILRVIDSYLGGRGWLGVHLFGAVRIASARGHDTDLGEAMRYLGEIVWSPDAILGNNALVWEMQEDGNVAVSLDVGEETARVILGFDAEGDVISITAHDRPAEPGPDGRAIRREWRGRVGDYARIGDRRVPRDSEVGYLYDTGYEPYWKGRILSVTADPV